MMPDSVLKESLRRELAELLTADLATRSRAYRTASEAATHEEAKPENDKDTRALEQSYLARGEAVRVEELRSALAEVQSMPLPRLSPMDPVGLGALVSVDEAGTSGHLWIAPHGGGARLGAGKIQVVTPKSPMGRALIGKRAGDDCEIMVAGRTREIAILAVR
ncbi:MAG: GreA/GreB family elongation factor [Polyangiaceae bacterium]|jgi:transcription elongation GreA/GreB family factor